MNKIDGGNKSPVVNMEIVGDAGSPAPFRSISTTSLISNRSSSTISESSGRSSSTMFESPVSFSSSTPTSSLRKRKLSVGKHTPTGNVSRQLFAPYDFRTLERALDRKDTTIIKQELLAIKNHPNIENFFKGHSIELVRAITQFAKYDEVVDFMENVLLPYLIEEDQYTLRMEILEILWKEGQFQDKQLSEHPEIVFFRNSQCNLLGLIGRFLLEDSGEIQWIDTLSKSKLIPELLQTSLWKPMIDQTKSLKRTMYVPIKDIDDDDCVNELLNEENLKESDQKLAAIEENLKESDQKLAVDEAVPYDAPSPKTIFSKEYLQSFEDSQMRTEACFFTLIFNMRNGSQLIQNTLNSIGNSEKQCVLFNLILTTIADLAEEIITNKKGFLICGKVPFINSLIAIFQPSLVNSPDFLNKVNDDAEQFLRILRFLPPEAVPQNSIQKESLEHVFINLKIKLTNLDIWELTLCQPSFVFYNLYIRQTPETRDEFIKQLALTPLWLSIIGPMTAACSSADFVKIYSALSEDQQSQLVKWQLAGVTHVNKRTDIFDSDGSIVEFVDGKAINMSIGNVTYNLTPELAAAKEKTHIEYTEEYRRTQLFLAKALQGPTDPRSMAACKNLQTAIGRQLSIVSIPCLVQFFNDNELANGQSDSFFNILFTDIFDQKTLVIVYVEIFNRLTILRSKYDSQTRTVESLQRENAQLQLSNRQDRIIANKKEIKRLQKEISAYEKRYLTNREDDFLEQIVFSAHPIARQKFISAIETNKAQNIINHILSTYIRHLIDRTKGKGPEFTFKTYQDIETRLLERLSSVNRDNVLKHLETFSEFKLFLTWHKLYLQQRTDAPPATYMFELFACLKVILRDTEHEQNYVRKYVSPENPCFNIDGARDDILSTEVCPDQQDCYRELTICLISPKIRAEVVEELNMSASAALRRFGKWLNANKDIK